MAKLVQLSAAGVGRWLRLPPAVRLVPPATLMALLWWSSSCEPSPVGPSLLRAALHNTMHVVAYALLGGTMLLALHSRVHPHRARAAVVALMTAVAYGLIDEWHQSFVPGRVCSLADVFADASGAALSIALLLPLLRGRPIAVKSVALCLLAAATSVLIATW